jgi:hypothetical protein
VKARKLDYLMSSLEQKKRAVEKDYEGFVVLPAFNAEKNA